VDVLDISHRFDALELERVNLETYYVELQERLQRFGTIPLRRESCSGKS
jgi:hypothetical protein